MGGFKHAAPPELIALIADWLISPKPPALCSKPLKQRTARTEGPIPAEYLTAAHHTKGPRPAP